MLTMTSLKYYSKISILNLFISAIYALLMSF